MITVGMDYKVIPGKDEEFTSMFSKVMDIMKDMPGHTVTHLYRDVYSENDYLVISEWSDQAAFDDFIASDRFKGVTNWGKENVLRDRPKHEIYGQSDGLSSDAKCPAGVH